jgi:dolichyl-phosphate-mannose-protein mannosyltransferase
MPLSPLPPAPVEAPGQAVGGLAWRHELAWAIAVTLLGFALRIGAASNSAVEHFDEGVYASNLFMGPDTGYRFPNQHLYAPPLHPAMIEWGMILFGLKTGPMLPGVILGGLTVPLLWWTVRGMFGGVAGLIAALILACDDFHIAHSASALTDVPVTFWILLSVGWLASGIEERDWWRTVLGGAAGGIAWWTKYSGWLPLAIVGSAVLVSGVVERQGWREVARRLGHWLVAVAVALAVWSPWLWELQGKGGYQAVAANHRGYVVGWEGWWESAGWQVSNLSAWDGWQVMVILAVVLCKINFDGHSRFTGNAASGEGGRILAATWSDRHSLPKYFALYVPIVLVMVRDDLIVLTGSAAVVSMEMYRRAVAGVVSRKVPRPTPQRTSAEFVPWCLLAWWIGLLITIPLYKPYPRLMAALMIPAIIWLVYGMFRWVDQVVEDSAFLSRAGVERRYSVSRETLGWGLYALLAVAVVIASRELRPDFGRQGVDVGPRTSLHELAHAVAERVAPAKAAALPLGLSPLDTAIYVYGEPALVHHLRVLGCENAVPTSHLGFARQAVPASPVPTFVVIGPHARESARFAEQWAEVHPEGRQSRLVLVADMPVRVSRMVALDRQPPRFEETFTLYRVD